MTGQRAAESGRTLPGLVVQPALFADCGIPGCRNLVAEAGAVCGHCRTTFGPMLQPGRRPPLTALADQTSLVAVGGGVAAEPAVLAVRITPGVYPDRAGLAMPNLPTDRGRV